MKHHFKFALRQLFRNKLIAFGSLTSMVVGVLSACLIYVWVDNELSTDRLHKNVDNIYLTVFQQSPIDQVSPIGARLFFKVNYGDYPQVKSVLSTALYNENRIKLVKGEVEYRGRGLVTDSTFFDFFDFELLEGDRENVMKDPTSLVITESMAKKIFGDQDPIGETLYLECDRTGYFEVRAIMKDIPSNSSISFDFMVPSHMHKFWGIASQEFLLVEEGFDKAAFDESFKHVGRNHPQFKESILSTVAFTNIYFDYRFSQDLFVKFGNRDEVNTLILVALVVLFVSIFNFTNLQTTLTISQLKTRGIKQVNGASKTDFTLELFVNRFIYAGTCIVVTFLCFELIKPYYLNFLGIGQNFTTLELLLTLLIGISVFVMLSALITLFQTSSVVTSQALMGNLNKSKKSNAGKFLTTVQYVFAITLIIVTGVVFKQFNYMQNKSLGYEEENVVGINFFERVPYNFDNPEITRQQELKQREDYKLVKSELLKIPGVVSFSQGPLPVDGSASSMAWKLANSEYEYTDVNLMTLEPTYQEILGLEVVKGRFFSDSLDRSRQHKVVINEAAMKYWNIDDVEDAKIASSSWSGEDDPWQVIGVVKDFHFEHLSKKVEPLVMTFFNDVEKEFLIRLNGERFQETISEVKTLFGQVNPKRIFEYTLLENKVQAQYDREKKLSQIFILFTLVGLALSSIGLFTFALYETRKRIKEIGIRKVVGANVSEVVRLLSVSFVKWVLLAFVIACPLGWYFMNGWLANFANQTTLSWWLFGGAGLLTLILALLTVIGQTYVAARRNPVDSLRYE
ncbi:ABC transporter permease [Roseivirga sp. E12]|uniref:ABC transporter permease n=1 Tax=Roseivirga sp. E12 TaxID=2819237 RepID=UPI001ABCCC69|nr:ABC transporter permease [Roseivirga sp. E12]MBO3698581.1 ABC transporter permease [Roseivirga sp. E12]